MNKKKMEKRFLFCKLSVFLILILALASLLCACGWGEVDTMDKDRRNANQKFQNILEAVQKRDDSTLRSLFSKESIQNTHNFDEKTGELFSYFQGDVESVNDWGGCYVETSKEDDNIYQVIEATYDVKTTEGVFRFAIQYISQDSSNPKNVGVNSLYVIRVEANEVLEYAYWGDGRFASGIHIDIPNEIG